MLVDYRKATRLAPRIPNTFYFAHLFALYLDVAPDSRKAMDEAGCGLDYLVRQQKDGFATSPRHVEAGFYRLELTGQVMLLFKKGNVETTELLKDAFPEIWEEWQARMLSKNGMLDSDRINQAFEEAELHDQTDPLP